MTKRKGKNKRPGSVNPQMKVIPGSEHARRSAKAVYYRNKLARLVRGEL